MLEHRRTLRGWRILLVLELGDRELHLLDQQHASADFGFEIARLGFCRKLGCRRFSERRLAGEHQRLQRRNIIGKRIAVIITRRWNHTSGVVAPSISRDVRVWRSTHSFGPPRPLRMAPIDAFEQIAKLRRRDHHRSVCNLRPDETAALQALGEQAHALAFMPQNFDQTATAAAEHEQVAAMRIALQRLLDQQRQTVEALAKASCALTKSSFSMYL